VALATLPCAAKKRTQAFFGYVELEPSDYMPLNIADFRAAQLVTNKLQRVGFAIATDIGDPMGPFGMVSNPDSNI
jgi:hypothetical protein